MLIFVVKPEVFFGSDNFLGLPWNLRGEAVTPSSATFLYFLPSKSQEKSPFILEPFST